MMKWYNPLKNRRFVCISGILTLVFRVFEFVPSGIRPESWNFDIKELEDFAFENFVSGSIPIFNSRNYILNLSNVVKCWEPRASMFHSLDHYRTFALAAFSSIWSLWLALTSCFIQFEANKSVFALLIRRLFASFGYGRHSRRDSNSSFSSCIRRRSLLFMEFRSRFCSYRYSNFQFQKLKRWKLTCSFSPCIFFRLPPSARFLLTYGSNSSDSPGGEAEEDIAGDEGVGVLNIRIKVTDSNTTN